VNSSGLVARYVYLPFGAMVADGPNPNVSAYRFMGQEWDAELSLCNFRDRMYDPILRRFLVPDAARQFPSPYVFCGNNPLNASDPSGDSSLWARIAIGLGTALTILAGVALSVVTLGAAAPAAAAADAAAVGAGVGAEAAAGVTAGVEGGAAAAATGAEAAAGTSAAAAGQAAAEGGVAGASEVGVGVAVGGADGGGAAAPAAAAQSGWITAGNFGIQVLSGTVQGAGTSGLQYDIQYNRDFTVAGFFESVGWGAAGGALGAGLVQGPLVGFGAAINELSSLAKFGAIVGINGVAGAASSGVTSILANVAAHEPWYQGVWESTVIGLGEGAVLAGLGEAVPESFKQKISPKVSEETIQNLNSGFDTMVDRALAAARTQEGTAVLIVGGFFTVAAIFVGGVTGIVKSLQTDH
jgi:RHS repeat-associated protein